MRRLRMDGTGHIALLAAVTIALRLLMFAGRGDYVAFDEGWYLLLGRNLLAGEGFSLAGLRHATLSPLFPLLAGALDVLTGNAVWSGRIIAAVAAGLLVIPCWSIFHRLAGRRTATLACLVVVALPALAPFTVPYWVGRDLWVGAEPLLHLFLFSGIALVLRGRDSGRTRDWIAAGAAFALAYLARPEAILVLGATGLLLGGAALYSRRPVVAFAHAAVLGLSFALVASPYWIYLHDVLGRWAITGRGIEVTVRSAAEDAGAPSSGEAGPTATIEQMLWSGDATTYVQRLYSLDASRTRLASDYWGVPRADRAADGVAVPVVATSGASAASEAQDGARSPSPLAAQTPAADDIPPSRVVLYGRALGWIVPWATWPFILLGVLGSVRRRRAPRGDGFPEMLLVGPLIFASLAIARIVAIDPRTQLLLLPLAALYCAYGLRLAPLLVARPLRRAGIRRSFVGAALVMVTLTLLLGTQARWLYMSIAVGSPHHMAGASNREVGALLQQRTPADATIMSWHPAIALYARRDWRVLPHAGFDDIVRFAGVVGTRHIVLSRYYPGPPLSEDLAARHVLLHVPVTPDGEHWRLHVTPGEGEFLFGELVAEPVRAGTTAATAAEREG
jgi:hypothetical protein